MVWKRKSMTQSAAQSQPQQQQHQQQQSRQGSHSQRSSSSQGSSSMHWNGRSSGGTRLSTSRQALSCRTSAGTSMPNKRRWGGSNHVAPAPVGMQVDSQEHKSRPAFKPNPKYYYAVHMPEFARGVYDTWREVRPLVQVSIYTHTYTHVYTYTYTHTHTHRDSAGRATASLRMRWKPGCMQSTGPSLSATTNNHRPLILVHLAARWHPLSQQIPRAFALTTRARCGTTTWDWMG
jgi:hypothetical protein